MATVATDNIWLIEQKLQKIEKPKVLDLFCGAGGCGAGYHRAGFYVFGIDIADQPKYPYDFARADWKDALDAIGHLFDFVHASPPCQNYSLTSVLHDNDYPELVDDVRTALVKLGKPYVIENVRGAPLKEPLLLNGSVFGLFVHKPRLFECSFDVPQPRIPPTPAPVKMGRKVRKGQYIQPIGNFSGAQYAREQMEIDWMTRDELAQAVPPAYTKYIGKHWMDNIWNSS
jgi:DNA (cytosine-5)-methyltransferase 1